MTQSAGNSGANFFEKYQTHAKEAMQLKVRAREDRAVSMALRRSAGSSGASHAAPVECVAPEGGQPHRNTAFAAVNFAQFE